MSGTDLPPPAPGMTEHRGGGAVRVLRSIAGAFSGATLGWVAAAAVTGGDFLDASDPSRLAGVAVATAVGVYLSLRARGRRGQIAVYLVTALCILFWVAVPAGWWATSPPPPPTRADSPVPAPP